MKKERNLAGETYLLGYIALAAFFPIVVYYETRIMPPILFAGVSTLVSGIGVFLYTLFKRGNYYVFHNIKAFFYILINMFCSVVIPFILFFIGAGQTSAINTVLLPNIEIFFAFFICVLFYGETITFRKSISAAVIFLGTIAILYNQTFEPHWGDLLIIGSALFYPIGNIYLKKALLIVNPFMILSVRNIIGGALLILTSMLFENYSFSTFAYIKNNILIVLFNGIFILGIARLMWFEGLKRLDVSKSTSISTAQPAFGLLYAIIFLGVMPTLPQTIGFFIIVGGLFMFVKTEKVSPLIS